MTDFAQGFEILLQLDPVSFLAMFWHAVLFEFPRFLIATVAVAAAEFTTRQRAVPSGGIPSPPQWRVSVLMPGHNEGASLEKCIMGLREQIMAPAQIVVVDDGSTDNMAEVARRLKNEGHIDVFVSTGLRGGKSAAANLGLGYCTGDIVMIGDIDTSFDRNALSELVAPFEDARVGAVCGNLGVRNYTSTMIARFQAIQYLISISLGRRVSDMLGILLIASGAFAAFRREALHSIGGWEIGPGEDADLTIKLRRAGWRIRFQPTAWALTDVPETFAALVRQRLRWNRSLIRIRMRKFKHVLNPLERNFALANALGTLDIIYFQAVLPGSFLVYVVWLFGQYGNTAWAILLATTAMYIVLAIFSFIIAASLSAHYGRAGLLLYVPGYAVFNAFVLRLVGVYSYLDELMLRRSYNDTYVPQRVLNRADRF